MQQRLVSKLRTYLYIYIETILTNLRFSILIALQPYELTFDISNFDNWIWTEFIVCNIKGYTTFGCKIRKLVTKVISLVWKYNANFTSCVGKIKIINIYERNTFKSLLLNFMRLQNVISKSLFSHSKLKTSEPKDWIQEINKIF